MTIAVTYDMQKLDEAVSALATGTKSLQERLRDAFIPLGTLHSGGGMKNQKRAPALEEIYAKLIEPQAINMSDDEARELATTIVELQTGNWHDAVYALEDAQKGR